MRDAAGVLRSPLRVVLVASGDTVPAWLCRCLEEASRGGVAEVVGILRAPGPRHATGSALYRLHTRVDRRLFRRMPDALAPVSIAAALPHCPVLTGSEVGDRNPAEPPDVVIDPFALVPMNGGAPHPRYGVWTLTFGRTGDPKTQAAPGYWEVAEGTPETETRLCMRRNGSDGALAIHVSVAPTDRRSVSRNLNHIFWKMAGALGSKLRQLWQDPETFARGLDAVRPFDAVQHPSAPPRNLQVVRACTRLARRYIADKWRDAHSRAQWALAYQLGGGVPGRSGTLETLLPPADRFWADPFPVRVGNEYYVFYEEARFATGKGYLLVTVLDEHGRILAPGIPVLEEDHHLSYPFVFQWGGDFFMIPETASQQCVQLYRCIRFPDRWKAERVLLSGLPAFDATPAFYFGRWWLFANVAPYGARSMDELHLFHADSPLGPWAPHRANPVKSDVRSARPAGSLFERDGHLLRPAQDCSRHYGYAVSINRILRLDPEMYEEVEVDKIVPDWGPAVTGVHTFNSVGDLTVIDCLIRRRRPWRSLPASLRSYNM